MRLRRRLSRTAAAIMTMVAVTGLLATSLAAPSATEIAVSSPPLQADILAEETDSDVGTARADEADSETLVTLEGLAAFPWEEEAAAQPAAVTGSVGSGDLGFGATITLQRPASRTDIDVAVAEGLALTGFTTTILVPSAVNEVQLDIAIDGSSVFSALVEGGTREVLEITLETPLVKDAVLSIAVEERFGSVCTSTAVEPSAVQLIDNEFYFEQLDNRPRTIADFFPPVLESVIVLVDPEATSSVRSAAYELSTALARRYPTMPAVDVVHQAVAAGPFAERANALVPISDNIFTRTIVLTEADQAAMTIRQGRNGTYLEIAGPTGLLEEMASAVSSPELSFVTKESVEVEELPSLSLGDDLLGQRSLRDVGVRRLVASSSRVLQLPIALPQAVFGEPVNEIRVRVGGLALASGTAGRQPVVTLWLNGDLQDVVDYDESGRFDIELVIDGSEIKRDNVLLIRSELALECGDQLPTHELSLDAASWVDANPGQSLPVSLDRFPQVAVGHLGVAAGDSENELELAMTILGVLQGASPLPIHPQSAPVERLVAGFSPGLVITDGRGEVASAMARDLTTVRSDELAFVSGERPTDLAFLSTSITPTNQDLLVVFSPDEELSQTFAEVARTRGWSAFGGNAIGVRGDGDVVQSDVSATAEAEAALMTLEAAPDEGPSIARQMALGAALALVLAAALFMGRFVLGALRHLR